MSMLDKISTPADKPVICTITGDAGVGKTRLAGTFPNPIFIRAEDGMQSIPSAERPDAFPLINKVPQLWDQLTALINEDHDYQTLVIDSVTALERLFIEHVVKEDPKDPASINQALGGYGAGLRAVASMHQRIRKAAGLLRDRKGMHIVFVAHVDDETVDPPDGESYTRYSLRLGKRSVAPYVDDVDLVGFLKLAKVVDGNAGKATSYGERELTCYTSAAHISKNRFGITEDIDVPEGINPLGEFISSLNENEGE